MAPLQMGVGRLSGIVFWARIPQKTLQMKKNHPLALRPAILDLAEKFESAGGWASERVFSKWVSKQDWRQCLPPVFQFAVERET